MIFRVGFLVAASVAAFAVSQITTNCSRKGHTRGIKNCDSGFQQEQIQEQENDKFEDTIVSIEPKQEEEEEVRIHLKKWNNVSKIELLKNAVKEMEQRRVTLEMKLLELYGLKQQQLDTAQLHKLLKAKNAEIDTLNVTLNVLILEMNKLHEEVRQNQLAEQQLEIAKRRILEIQAKLHIYGAQMKGQLMVLKEQVLGFDMEDTSMRDDKVEKKLRAMEGVELEAMEMRRRNKELQLEIRELTVKLVAAQTRITTFSKLTESKIIAQLEEEISSLRHANKGLLKQVERLQNNRFNTVEELVYQRWLNVCLRFEIKDHHNPSQSTSKCDLRKKLSFESRQKSKQLMPLSVTNFDSISSEWHTSSLDSDTTTNTTSTSYSSSQTISKKSSLIHNIKRWGRSKNDSSGRSSLMSKTGPIRRFSMSTVPSDTSALRKKGETETFPHARGVSFSDSVKEETSTFQDMVESTKGVSDNEEIIGGRFEDGLIKSTICKFGAEMVEEEPETSSVIASKLRESGIGNKEDLNSGMANLVPSESKVGDQRVHLIAAVIFFLLIILIIRVVLN